MRKWINILLRETVEPQIEVRGSHSGQLDCTMSFKSPEGKLIGYIDYSVYGEEVHVQMIKVRRENRRQGLGSKMIKALQKEYPNTEINIGSTTEEGDAFFKAVNAVEVPVSDVQEKLEELKAVRAKLADYYQRHEELIKHVHDDNYEEMRAKFMDEVSDWSDLHDREWALEKEIGNRRPTKRIFERRNWLKSLRK